MDISVVIGSFNQKNRLKRVMDGYMGQETSILFEVVVVDSMSTDGTAEMMSEFGGRDVPFSLKFIQRQNPSGKAEARNVGVSNAAGTFIIITDADMIPEKSFVQAHYNAHLNSNQPCCFEGLAYNLQSYDWPPQINDKMVQVPIKYVDGDQLDWYYFLTGNISFPVDIFNIESGFSLDFKSYGWEDLELGYRLKKRNIPLYYLTSACNYHYHVISDDEKIDRKYTMGQSAQIFIRKHPELKLFLGVNPISIFIRRRLSKRHFIYRGIKQLRQSKWLFLRRFSCWFLGEFNYLSGVLNLSENET